ncbi:MAG: DNA-binding domain-containing protein [Spirochaetales bacterium]|nr:DNA-binding domain-containing protein [Spirochaetales bacterium]
MKAIDYYLRENYLSTSEENRYMANVVKKKTVEQEELINIMLGKNTTVTRQDTLVVMDLLKETVMEQILSGFPVKTDLFKANVSIRGSFVSSDDSFDSTRHKVCVNIKPADDFKADLIKNAQVEHVDPNQSQPFIRQVFDYESQELRDDLASGALIGLKGGNFTEENRETRVYLTREGETDKIAVGKIYQVKGRSILCFLPDNLEAGEYSISVVIGEGAKANQGTYDNSLTIS